MIPFDAYKDDIFRELEEVLANAEPEQIEQLLHDIAHGEYSATAETRAGDNDDQSNVTNINQVGGPVKNRDHKGTQLSDESRQMRRAGYSA